ncbi:MAG: polysaccharide biosynthesis/export family protein [Prevotella sp.]|nr:polysaccharide biosynthesis/export family protein [Prevotella sp.]
MKYSKLVTIALAAMIVTSCKVPTNVSYFQDLKNGQVNTITSQAGIKLKEGDKISIVVKSKNNEISNMLNLPVATQVVGYTNDRTRGISGYTIDRNGDIDFPMAGKLHIAGLSREEVAEFIKKTIEEKELAKDVVVTVEFLNLHFSVMGEVGRPGDYSFGQDRVTLLEALAQAGDLTLHGMRDSVYVLRTVDGKQTTHVVSMLNAREMLNSPAYYLQQNDVVYVVPNDYRKRQSKVNGNTFQSTSFWISISSVLISLVSLLHRL